MKSLLICPADRPAVGYLAENSPLALIPLLGKSLVEHWVEALAARGATHVLVLASDRPHQVRAALGDGARWGVQLDVLPESRELTVEEARDKYRPAGGPDWLPEHDVVMMDHPPGQPELPLFESYAGWFEALETWMPHAVTPARIGVREIAPGIWVGLHAQISPTAQLHAPCWIGEHVLVGPGAVIGPGAILEDRSIVESGARILKSVVGPETFVGELISVQHSLATGSTLIDWQNSSCLRVPDAFFLCSLTDRRFASHAPPLAGRVAALIAMLLSSPIAMAIMALSLVRGDNPLQLRLGVRPQRNVRSAALQTFAYYELAGAKSWLRRWPQFWSVVRGDMAWVGNRPLRPTQALALANDFERLWLMAPIGLVSLADVHGCEDMVVDDEACAHASYYAVNASRRLDWFILRRALVRSAGVWPILRGRVKDTAVPLPQLVPKQQG